MLNRRVTLTGAQLRAARGLLDISAEELAEKTQIGLRTIGRAEGENGPVRMTPANAARIIEELERRGVVFIDDEVGGPGVRLRTPLPAI